MTNKEKAIEVFGDNPKRHYITKSWWDEEYVPPIIIEADKAEIEKEEKEEDVLNKIKAEIIDTLYVDSLIFGELIDFRNGKISADDVIDEFNRVTRIEVLQIIDKYKAESEE